MPTSYRISTSCPGGGRRLVEDALCLRVRDLRRSGFGWVAPDLTASDGTLIRTCIEVSGETAAWLFLEHWQPSAAWAAASYAVALVPLPQRFGGARWLFRDPGGFGLCAVLYLPAGASSFASRQALGLVHRSQRQRAPARAAARADRLRRDLGGSEPFRPKGMHAATFARRLALLARMEVAASAN